MTINPRFYTAKQGKDDALEMLDGCTNDTRLLLSIVVRFGSNGYAKDCTAAYRRAFFDTITLKA